MELIAVALFVVALLHSFSTRGFEHLAHRSARHASLFHLLSEVELVFGFWAAVLVVSMAAMEGVAPAIAYVESRSFTEPLFVFVIMVVAGSRPVLEAARACIDGLARGLPLPQAPTQAWLCLSLLPLSGSLITEPAAMTLAALMLAPQVFRPEVPERLKYAALGVLFVNVSIGGCLTAYAAPPVLMVAERWGWDSGFMAQHFGWRAALAVLVNASVVSFWLRRHLRQTPATAPRPPPAGPKALEAPETPDDSGPRPPLWVIGIHLAFLAGIVASVHHPVIFVGLFLLFLGFTQAYDTAPSPLLLRQALLVAMFLAGLVVLGGQQEWWLQPLVAGLPAKALFFGSMALTAITDNAAITYLGSLISGLPDPSKMLLVAGALSGGGLTVIANAPNPAGAALLKQGFEDGSIGAGSLLLGALAPTAVAALAFWW
jgi:hypothetical protein